MKLTERFEKVNIDRLVPYARNARTHSKEQILQLAPRSVNSDSSTPLSWTKT
jgi:hypothetical protein